MTYTCILFHLLNCCCACLYRPLIDVPTLCVLSSVQVFLLTTTFVEFPYNWSFILDIEPSLETVHRWYTCRYTQQKSCDGNLRNQIMKLYNFGDRSFLHMLWNFVTYTTLGIGINIRINTVCCFFLHST